MHIKINEIEYEIIKNEKNGFDKETVEVCLTDFYNDFDYVVGDWAYGKLRLKGFNEKTNKKFKPYNDFSKVDEYIEQKCAYGCKYFILKKVKN